MEITELKKLLNIDSKELNTALRGYGANDTNNPTQKEVIYTAFDLFFERAFNNMLLKGVISDSQRDSVIINLLNELDFTSFNKATK